MMVFLMASMSMGLALVAPLGADTVGVFVLVFDNFPLGDDDDDDDDDDDGDDDDGDVVL
jgi:hypothetical protein